MSNSGDILDMSYKSLPLEKRRSNMRDLLRPYASQTVDETLARAKVDAKFSLDHIIPRYSRHIGKGLKTSPVRPNEIVSLAGPDGPSYIYLGAGCRIIGVLEFTIVDNATLGNPKGQFSIYTHRNARRKGVATALLDVLTSEFPVDFGDQKYTPEGYALTSQALLRLDVPLLSPEDYASYIVPSDSVAAIHYKTCEALYNLRDAGRINFIGSDR